MTGIRVRKADQVVACKPQQRTTLTQEEFRAVRLQRSKLPGRMTDPVWVDTAAGECPRFDSRAGLFRVRGGQYLYRVTQSGPPPGSPDGWGQYGLVNPKTNQYYLMTHEGPGKPDKFRGPVPLPVGFTVPTSGPYTVTKVKLMNAAAKRDWSTAELQAAQRKLEPAFRRIPNVTRLGVNGHELVVFMAKDDSDSKKRIYELMMSTTPGIPLHFMIPE